MPKIEYQEQPESKYPIYEWLMELKRKHKEWKRLKKTNPPILVLVQGKDFDIKVESMRRYIYEYKPQFPISTTVSGSGKALRISWNG